MEVLHSVASRYLRRKAQNTLSQAPGPVVYEALRFIIDHPEYWKWSSKQRDILDELLPKDFILYV
jgi:hypothetical protein